MKKASALVTSLPRSSECLGDESCDISHAEGENERADKGHKDDVDAFVVRDGVYVPIAQRRHRDHRPVQRNHVPAHRVCACV